MCLSLPKLHHPHQKNKYFRATLHNGEVEKTMVSYNANLHPIMESAKLSDKPIKLGNYTEVTNDFDNSTCIKLDYQSNVEYSPVLLLFDKVKGIN